MFLAMISLFRERLPCSENYWRYKRNYEIHMQIISKENGNQSPGINVGPMEEKKSNGSAGEAMGEKKKFLAPSHMSFVKPLNHYNDSDIKRKLSVSG